MLKNALNSLTYSLARLCIGAAICELEATGTEIEKNIC